MEEREYSAHSGLSRGAIQKARRASRLVVYSDGSINAAASDVRRGEMTDPDQQRRSTGGDSGFSGPADSSCYLKARTALTVYQAQDKQLAIQKRKPRWSTGPRRDDCSSPRPARTRHFGVTAEGKGTALRSTDHQPQGKCHRPEGANRRCPQKQEPKQLPKESSLAHQ